MDREFETRPLLEKLVESLDIGLEVLHPGGLEITKELGELCKKMFGVVSSQLTNNHNRSSISFGI